MKTAEKILDEKKCNVATFGNVLNYFSYFKLTPENSKTRLYTEWNVVYLMKEYAKEVEKHDIKTNGLSTMKTEQEIKNILQKLHDRKFQISFNELLKIEDEENPNEKRIKLSVELEKTNAQIEILEEVIGYKYEYLKEVIKK